MAKWHQQIGSPTHKQNVVSAKCNKTNFGVSVYNLKLLNIQVTKKMDQLARKKIYRWKCWSYHKEFSKFKAAIMSVSYEAKENMFKMNEKKGILNREVKL